jgi:DNA-binding transcriptional MerR regulator
MTRDEVAKMLGCSTKTVTRYGQSGIIRPLKFGANRRKAFGYSAQSVQAAIQSGAMA